jgi:hydroxyethylthiazole kinase-like sugar kinase family protein
MTMRLRSAALVSDGGLFDCDSKQFMPVLDWFVFQIKKETGVDAYPFPVLKNADLTKIMRNLTNTYSAIIYLDSRTDFEVPKNSIFIRHQDVAQLAKCEATDAAATARVASYLMDKRIKGEPSQE